MEKDIVNIINDQNEFFNKRKTYSYSYRLSKLKKLKNAIVKYEQEIHDALKKDLNKNPYESYMVETGFILHEISTAIKNLKKWMKPKRVPTPLMLFPSMSYLNNEPLGKVLIIGPWNYPFHLVLIPFVGAIAAGNTCIIKPSEISVNSSIVIEKIIKEAFSSFEATVINGGVKETQILLNHKFDHIFFTGSTSVGKIIAEKAAKFLTPVTLELGGKCPCIVLGKNDVNLVAKRIIWGKFLNAGQTCISPDYILVEDSLKDALVEKLIYYINKFFGENENESPFYGRIVNEKNFNRLKGLFSKEKIIYGGKTSEGDRFISPTIIEADNSSEIMKEEIFGPIIPILKIKNLEDCLEIINSRPSPLAVYLYSKEKKIHQKIIGRTNSGAVCINDNGVQLGVSKLPFGGMGESGLGRYHGKASFDIFSNKKSIVKRFQFLDFIIAPARYVPYFKDISIIRWVWKLFG